VWLVIEILSYLDARSLARSESAWTSFSAAADASHAWAKLLAADFPGRTPAEAVAAEGAEGSTDVPSARATYSQFKIAEGPRKKLAIGAAPASKGLKLFKPPTA
jgi:hypothetical protein